MQFYLCHCTPSPDANEFQRELPPGIGDAAEGELTGVSLFAESLGDG